MTSGGWVRVTCATALLVLLSACGKSDADAPRESPTFAEVAIEPGSRAEAQNRLETAAAHVESSGSGAFLLTVKSAPPISIDGVWDSRSPATDYVLTFHGANNGDDVVDRTRILKDAAFTQLSNVDDPICWMKLGSADRSRMGIDGETSPVHPAARMLLEPHALGVVKESRVDDREDVTAEVAFEDALSAVSAKALAQLSKPPPHGVTVPVTVGLDGGKYVSVSYLMDDIVRAANDSGVDLFGPAGEDAGQVAERLAHARIEITYRSFGEDVEIVAPAPSEILDIEDLAGLKEFGGTPETCAAAKS